MRIHRSSPLSAPSEKPQILAEIGRCVGANVKSKATIQWLLGLLDSTDDTQIRNQAAYALADLRVEAAVPILVRLLSSEVAANHRGPLLFALLPLNYHNYLGAIAPYLDSEEYELVEYALQLLEQLPPRLKARQTRDAIKRLEQLAVSSANTEYVNQGIFLLKAATYPKL